MAKKAKAPSASSHTATQTPSVTFPTISVKEGLECRALLEDQILLIDVRLGVSTGVACKLY